MEQVLDIKIGYYVTQCILKGCVTIIHNCHSYWFIIFIIFLLPAKVRSLFKDSKQKAGCTEFRTETGLHSLVSVQKFVHPAICLPSLKRERTLRYFTEM